MLLTKQNKLLLQLPLVVTQPEHLGHDYYIDIMCIRINKWNPEKSLSVTCGKSVVSSTNETDRHDKTEILLKVALNTMHISKAL